MLTLSFEDEEAPSPLLLAACADAAASVELEIEEGSMLTDEEVKEDDKDARRDVDVIDIIIIDIIIDDAVVIVFFFCEATRRERISLRRVLSLYRNVKFFRISFSIKKSAL